MISDERNQRDHRNAGVGHGTGGACRTNGRPRLGGHLLTVALWVGSGLFGCAESNDGGGPDVSSGTHWQACTTDADCTRLVQAVGCGDDGYCVDADGERVMTTPGSGPSPAGSGGSGGSAGSGSGPDEATLRQSILDEADALNSCTSAAECTNVTLPFSCDAYFLNASADRTQLDALIAEYSASFVEGGLACTLACRCGELVCDAGKCMGIDSDCMSATGVCL
ncbi:MAG: hypothetical protein OEZ06_27960 [Myxococcales bacterium]|nr:hypothetical protein [Myxococcales bacterium]